MVRPLLYLYYNLLRVCSHCTRQLWRRDENHSRQGFCSGIRTVISTRHSVRSNWNLEVFVQPRTQTCSRYPSDQRRLGTERDSVLGEFSRQAWQVTSHPKSPRTTGNEAGVCFVVEEKNGVPGEKPLVARKITNNKLDPHMLSTLGFEPGPHVGGRRVLSPLRHPTLAPAPVMC